MLKPSCRILVISVFALAACWVEAAEQSTEKRPSNGKPEQQKTDKSDKTTTQDCDCSKKTAKPADLKGTAGYAPCICDKYPVYDLGDGTWVFYADQYDSCDNCVNPITVWDVESPPYQTSDCPNCHSGVVPPDPQLPRRKPWHYTRTDFFNDLYQQRDIPELAGLQLDYTVESDERAIEFFVNGSPVYAKVFLFSVKPAGHELIVGAFGVETDAPPNGTPASAISNSAHVKAHRTDWHHAYDVQFGPVSYLVITAQ